MLVLQESHKQKMTNHLCFQKMNRESSVDGHHGHYCSLKHLLRTNSRYITWEMFKDQLEASVGTEMHFIDDKSKWKPKLIWAKAFNPIFNTFSRCVLCQNQVKISKYSELLIRDRSSMKIVQSIFWRLLKLIPEMSSNQQMFMSFTYPILKTNSK